MTTAGYNSRKQMILCRRFLKLAMVVVWLQAVLLQADVAVNRAQPVADLAKQIAGIAGPGPVKLTIQNQSSLSSEELPAIRQMLERDLRGYGVLVSPADGATLIRVTLSENTTGGLWVAEIQEGKEVRVAMVHVDLGTAARTQAGTGITLRKTLVWQQREPVLDVLPLQVGAIRRMVVLEPERIESYVMSAGGWTKEQQVEIAHTQPFPRDMRGRLIIGQENLFDAYLPGALCLGAESNGALTVSCADNDDPWPLATPGSLSDHDGGSNTVLQKAFYNAMRNYFTGVLAPGFGMQLQPFYSAAAISRLSGVAELFSGVDGKVVIIENNTMKAIAGARDWGSDLATIHSGCGSGVQVLVSGSGTTAADSVRAYEIPGREAEPVSAPLALDGPVMAMWPSSDGTSATVVVQTSATGQAQSMQYEVYSVSALCN
jgi:hypothetical protein